MFVPSYARCAQCGTLWQWPSLCPECTRLADAAISKALFRGSRTPFHRVKVARGLHDHQRAAKTPRKKPTAD